MLKIKNSFILFTLVLTSLLTGCNNEEASFELTNFETATTEYEDSIQLEFQYDIQNHSTDDYYVTFIFPSFIQEALLEPLEPTMIPAGSNSSTGMVVGVSKSGRQMSEETIQGILSGEIPYFEEMIIGKAINLE